MFSSMQALSLYYSIIYKLLTINTKRTNVIQNLVYKKLTITTWSQSLSEKITSLAPYFIASNENSTTNVLETTTQLF